MMANELRAEHVKTIGLVSTDDATGKDSTDAISVAVGKLGITIKSPQTFKATQTDVSQEISEALQHPIDALVISAFPAQALSAAQAARTLGYQGKIFFDQTAAGDLFLTGAKGAAIAQAHMVGTESLVIDDVIATTPADVSRRQWFNDYTSKFGNFSGYSTYAADAIQIIAKAATAAGGTSNHGTLRQQIEITQFDGLSGQIRITPDNHSGLTSQALALLISIDDRWRLA
jgi:branched-chain amino acid transport system substrate-binding protein